MEEHSRHQLRPFKDEGRLRNLRQVLNVFFILGAIAGMLLYMNGSKDLGTYVMIGSCVFKFAELTLRILKL